MSCQLSQHCRRSWAVGQLAVQNIIRGRIRQYRHGCNYGRSAPMMGDTLTTISLKATEMVTKLTRKSLKARHKMDHRGQLMIRSQCPFLCRMSTHSLGHMTTVETICQHAWVKAFSPRLSRITLSSFGILTFLAADDIFALVITAKSWRAWPS